MVVDAFHKGNFKEAPYVKIDKEHNRIVGYTTRNSGGVPDNFKNYFVVEFDKPFTYMATAADTVVAENVCELQADHCGAIIGFSTHKGEIVHARVASSFISLEQALLNLNELGEDGFDTWLRKEDSLGMKCWEELKWMEERWTNIARSILVFIVRCCSRENSMK